MISSKDIITIYSLFEYGKNIAELLSENLRDV